MSTNTTVWVVLCYVYKHHCMDGPLLCLQRTLHGWSSAMATSTTVWLHGPLLCIQTPLYGWSSALSTNNTIRTVLCYVCKYHCMDGPLLCLQKNNNPVWMVLCYVCKHPCMVLCCVCKQHRMDGPLLGLQTPLYAWSSAMSANTTSWMVHVYKHHFMAGPSATIALIRPCLLYTSPSPRD